MFDRIPSYTLLKLAVLGFCMYDNVRHTEISQDIKIYCINSFHMTTDDWNFQSKCNCVVFRIVIIFVLHFVWQGATRAYDVLIRPILQKFESIIDEGLENAKKAGSQVYVIFHESFSQV